MHEAKFTSEIVNAVIESLKSQPGAVPRRVRVQVGEMLHLEPDPVSLHFELQTKGTALEGVELALEEIPVTVLCRGCGHQGGVDDHHFIFCGKCGSPDVEVKSGREVVIEQIEVV